jgi:hypothetical protein
VAQHQHQHQHQQQRQQQAVVSRLGGPWDEVVLIGVEQDRGEDQNLLNVKKKKERNGREIGKNVRKASSSLSVIHSLLGRRKAV